MEYLPYTITQFIKEGGVKNRKVDITKIICYIKGMLEGLAYLDVHFFKRKDSGICHRDIKPSNILVDPERKSIKLCDFGSAKKLKKG